MNKKRNKSYERVMPRVFNNSRVSSASNSHVIRHEVPSSVRVGAKPSVSHVTSSVFSELPTVLNDYEPVDSVKKVESSVGMSRVVKPKRTVKSLDTSKSRSIPKRRTLPVSRNLRAEESAPVVKGDEEWPESHLRQCYSSRSHTRLKDLKDEIKAYHETEKFMRWRSHLYKKCGVVFDEDGNVASDKGVQVDVEKEKDVEELRRRQWLTTVDRLDLLEKEHFSFKNYRICSAHFERSEIINTVRRELTKEAIPKVACEIVPFHQDKATQYETNTAEEVVASTSRRRKLTAKAKDTKFYGMIKFKKRRKRKSCISSQDLIDEVTGRSRKLAEFLKKMKKNRSEYKLFVLNFRYSNPNAYKCLKTILNLPSQSTLNKLKINISPKIDDRVLKILELKMKSLPENAKFCTICVNSMTLKRHLYYDIKNDEIIGVQNVNGQVMADTANDAYIIMLQGIVVEWELPIAYALLGTRENDYGTWLKEIISKLSAIGIEVTAIISSQRSNFTDLAKKYEPKAKKPYFAFNNLKLFCIFDVLHEIKCICNSLLTCDFYYDGKRISWDYIKQLYEDQKDQVKKLRLIPKITEKHVSSTDVDSDDTDFKEINFKYVAQIFSRSVSTALHTYVDLGKMPEEARTTAIFIETMNNVFDVLNSNKTNSNNKYQNAYSGNEDQEEILNDALQMFSLIRAVDRKASKTVKNAFGNIQISIQSIKMLFNDLQKKGIKYIFTRRLNQETLEKFLSTIYQGCSCKKPTPILFQRAFSKLFVSNLMESIPYDKDGKGNGGIDITDALFKAEKMVEVNYKWSIMPPQKSKVYLDGETDYRVDLPEDTLLYISSYLFFKCNDKHKCPTLDAAFESLPDFNKFESDNKDSEFYGRMKLPCADFVKYIKDLEVVFRDNFSVVERNPGGYLYELVKAVVPQYEPCPCFPFDYLLRLFVRLRIFARLKSNNNLIRELEKKKNYSFKKM